MKYASAHNDGSRSFKHDFLNTHALQSANISLRRNLTHTADSYQLITGCMFNNHNYLENFEDSNSKCDNFFAIPTTSGICNAFNSRSIQDIFKPSKFMHIFQSVYAFTPKENNDIIRFSGSGAIYKLTFFLNAQTVNYFGLQNENVKKSSFLVSVADVLDSPGSLFNGFLVSSGFKVQVNIMASEFASNLDISI